MKRWHIVLLLLLTGCHHRPSAFDQALAQAAEEKQHGQIDAARAHYRQARELARNRDQQMEASYRELLLLPDAEAAPRLRDLARSDPRAARAPRCLLDAGRIYRRQALLEPAISAWTELLRSYPSSASAPSALRGVLGILRAQDATGRAERAFIAKQKRHPGALEEELLFRDAEAIALTDASQAIVAYENVARRFPIPEGRFSDEALLRSAQLRLSGGDPQGALEITREIMRANEKSLMVGSYTRSAYAEASYLHAQILRDHGEDPLSAARAFERFPSQFPHSRLRDDALHSAAELYLSVGRPADACAAVRSLETVDPGSRFLRSKERYCGTRAPRSRGAGATPSP